MGMRFGILNAKILSSAGSMMSGEREIGKCKVTFIGI
jgi:hypothetical protein